MAIVLVVVMDEWRLVAAAHEARRAKRGAREPDRRTATAILRALEVSRK